MTQINRRFVPNLTVEKAISKLAQDETGKRQYYRPVYSIHKWWARRPGTLFRALILLATRPEIRNDLLQTDQYGNLVPDSPYFNQQDLDGFVILDPFMGGGTTIVEANRMGAKVIGEEVFLHKRTLLNEGASRNRPLSESNPATVFCPSCQSLFEWGGGQFANCPACGEQFDPYSGYYDEGFYQCPRCGAQDISLLETIRAGARLREVLIAIEYWCPRCRERLYKAPDEADRQLLDHIEQEYLSLYDTLVMPAQQIPKGASSRRWIQHGYCYYRELFNMRQILALNYLIEGIRGIEEREYQNCFFTILSNMLEYNNMMTPYNYPHRKLHHLFNYHAMPLTTTPVENAVWGAFEEGAGTFVNCYKRYENAKSYCVQPYEKFKDASGQVVTVVAKGEQIRARFVDTFEDLIRTSRGALLLCRDSSRLPEIPDGSVDFVITDPPYYDNVHYSELSNFFYVWLSMLVDEPAFHHELVPTEGEAVVNREMGKHHADYQRLLTQVFSECHRVLKDSGRLIFTFHHSKRQAWWTVFEAVSAAGFRIVDFFPVQSEYRVNPHIRNKQAIDMDLVLVCQKREQPFEVLSASPADALERAMQVVGFYENGNRTLVYLHFIGELLRSASCACEEAPPSYSWFETALDMFDSLAAATSTETVSRPPAVQLALFENTREYSSGQGV